ncbi:MAG: FeoB-associated Cys-rich membrane protein [Acidobacteria bacterium]|nr:FeoB-associated Cys-rich membrane protein [Acidobacteriota bacterium]
MNAQNIIVGLIILFACFYIGKNILKKAKSFSTKSSSCGADCGCGDGKSAAKNSFVNIQKS